MRTITEILKEADEATTLDELVNAKIEIEDNQQNYSIVELEFAAEHLETLTNKLQKK